ncbi:smg-9, nonsense mediated mRNA decay factor [Mortierella alpina]|nr:smg-9, nonsense mediated mRNA decay factor [Mortierella alpina]
MHRNSSSRSTGGSSSGGGGRGHGLGQGQQGQQGHAQGETAPAFKLLTRTGHPDPETNNSPRAGLIPQGPGVPGRNMPQPHLSAQQQQPYPAYAPQYPYSYMPPHQQQLQQPQQPQQQQQQQQLRPRPPNQNYMAPPPGLGGMNMNMGVNSGVNMGMGNLSPMGGANMSTNRGPGRRERSGSLMGQSSGHPSGSLHQPYPQQQQQLQPAPQSPQQQHTQSNQHHSDAGHSHSESDAKEPKPRRERRERSRRDRSSRSSQQQQQSPSQNDPGREEMNSSDGQKQQPHRFIVDPNSFQRQILQPNPNSSGGTDRKLVMSGSNSRGTGELYDDDGRGLDVAKSSSRRQVPAGRTVYSWQGSNSKQHPVQQQQQHPSQHQHQPMAARVSAGPYSQPGNRDVRSLGGPHSTGANAGHMSAGGRLLQAPPIMTIPPAMKSRSVKLMNEHGKILEGAEQARYTWLAEHSGHFVVGVLGGQGVGKSSLLSSFCPAPLASSAFTKQPPQMATVAGFQTSGIDMYITPERMILLDTEPIYCLSNLENALRNERILDGVPVDIWLDHQALSMATFLVSVCNIVLVMVEDGAGPSSRIMKLLQRVEVFMKALSQSSQSNVNINGNGAAPVASPNSASQPGMGQDGFQREGLGDWCADIILVSNKVPAVRFTVDHYRIRAMEQAQVLRHSSLRLFESIHMAGIYPRFEDAFKAKPAASGDVLTHGQKKRLSKLSSGVDSLSDADSVQETDEGQGLKEQQDVVHERKSAQQLNLVTLPYDSTLSSAAQAAASSLNTTAPSSSSLSTAPPSALLSSALATTMSSLSISLNRSNILGCSLEHPDHDVLATFVQDQERWNVWTKGLRNKILSFSMKPQGGPALGPRCRPGMVSEREWLRYASRTWDTIRKAEFLTEYVRAAKLSREG